MTASRPTLRIGRNPTCTYVVDDEYVSQFHAEIRQGADGRLLLIDLGSINGTWVNGQRVYRWTPVQSGDEIRVGHTTLHVP